MIFIHFLILISSQLFEINFDLSLIKKREKK